MLEVYIDCFLSVNISTLTHNKSTLIRNQQRDTDVFILLSEDLRVEFASVNKKPAIPKLRFGEVLI